jgi:hypothetical protein
MINLGFLTEGKLAAILITPSSWGSQWAGHSPRISGAMAVLGDFVGTLEEKIKGPDHVLI